MKKNLLAIISLSIGLTLSAQCNMQVACNWVSCYGACDATAQAYPMNMTAPITYLWMPGGQTTQMISGLCAGTYTCVATDSLGCMATAQCTVGSPAQLQAIITSYQNPSCPSCCDGFAIGSATGGTPAYTFLWTPSAQTSSTGQALCNGTYTLCVTDASGCSSCDTVSLSFPSAVIDQQNEIQMNVWGSDGLFTLSAQFPAATSGEIVVTDAMGQIVSRTSFSETSSLQNSINLKETSAGLYCISIVTPAGTTTRRISRN